MLAVHTTPTRYVFLSLLDFFLRDLFFPLTDQSLPDQCIDQQR